MDFNFRLVVLHHLMRFLEHQDTDGDFGSYNELGHRLFAANHVLSQDGKENVSLYEHEDYQLHHFCLHLHLFCDRACHPRHLDLKWKCFMILVLD